MKKKNRLFELIFDAPYKKHDNKFWGVFWKRKVMEAGKVLMWIVISIIAYFILLYFPSSLFMGDRAIKIKLNASVDSGQTRLVSSNYIHARKFEDLRCPEFNDRDVNLNFNMEVNRSIRDNVDYTNRKKLIDIIGMIYSNFSTMVWIANDENYSMTEYVTNYMNLKHKWIYKDITLDSFSIVNRVPIIKKQFIQITKPNIDDMGTATWDMVGYHFLVILMYATLFLIIYLIRCWLSSNYKKMMKGRRYGIPQSTLRKGV